MAASDIPNIAFSCPAGEVLYSLEEASKTFLDNCSKNWNNYQNPESSIHPPIFNYKDADVSDEVLSSLLANRNELAQNDLPAASMDTSGPCRLATIEATDCTDELDPTDESQRATLTKKRSCPPKTDEEATTSETSKKSFQQSTANKKTKEEEIVRLETDRKTYDAEYAVFRALEQLIYDKIQAPFIAIHNLKLDIKEPSAKRSEAVLQALDFSDTIKDELRKLLKRRILTNGEFDFVIIGPKIGLIAIEVKSGKLSDGFNMNKRQMPRDYKKALEQLEKVEALINVLERVTGANKMPPDAVRKIVFLSNLDKGRYEAWMNSLNEKDTSFVRADAVDIWFKDDLENKMVKGKPPLYDAFRGLLDASNIDDKGFAIFYEAYAPVMIALRALVENSHAALLGYHGNTLNFVAEKVSSSIAISLQKQKPYMFHKARNHYFDIVPYIDSAVDSNGETITVMFLNIDQRKALEGRRQLLLGSAGTGKTVIIQEKARRLLAEGQAVKIFAAKCFIENYKSFFIECKKAIEKQQKEGSIESTAMFGQFVVEEWTFDIAFKAIKRLLPSIMQYVFSNPPVILAFLRLLAYQQEILDKFLDNVFIKLIASAVGIYSKLHGLSSEFAIAVESFKWRIAIQELLKSPYFPPELKYDKDVYEFTTNDLETVCDHAEKAVHDDETKLYSLFCQALPWFKDYHIFVDDMIDGDYTTLRYPENFIIALVFFTSMAKKADAEKVLWLAMDLYRGNFVYQLQINKTKTNTDIFESLKTGLNSCSQNDERYSVAVLNKVMRCSENITKLAYNDETENATGIEWIKDVQGRCGHKIVGHLPIRENVHFSTLHQAVAALSERINAVVKDFMDKNVDLSQIAIIVGSHDEGEAADHMCNYLKSALPDFKKLRQERGQQSVDPNTNKTENKDAVKLYLWYDVSSLEWPIVLYVVCRPINYPVTEINYQEYAKYRGMTRAVAKLFYFDFTYDQEQVACELD